MNIGNIIGLVALVGAVGSVYFLGQMHSDATGLSLFALGWLLSIVAGMFRPRAWFFLTGALTLLFMIFAGVMWSIWKSGV